PKGCLKSKRVKSSLEQPSVKTQYKCKLYKQRGHNSKTCKEQEQLNTNANKRISMIKAKRNDIEGKNLKVLYI
ncbi:9109_t:CDS:2, partial [Funneliformis mosseae]